ncbi:MAG TPA: hypothetical protein V6D14_33475 [Coleofasciculaceae cyanobacterium]
MSREFGDGDSVERRAANYFAALSAVPPLHLAWAFSPLLRTDTHVPHPWQI